jgi:hypothetical protein
MSREQSAGLCHVGPLSYRVVMVLALEHQMHRAETRVTEMLYVDTTEGRVRLECLEQGTRSC